MDFSREGLTVAGFTGFIRVSDLQRGSIHQIPRQQGVYCVVREVASSPAFLATCPVPTHKGRPLAYSLDRLKRDWVSGCTVLYVGKANNLFERIDKYVQFGLGKPVPHRGGRSIWQLEDSADLLIAWNPLGPDVDPEDAENQILLAFTRSYGRLPFANKRLTRKDNRQRLLTGG